MVQVRNKGNLKQFFSFRKGYSTDDALKHPGGHIAGPEKATDAADRAVALISRVDFPAMRL